jgi:flavin-dependent dehydrogenase
MSERYNVIVVGAGSAGLAAAWKTAEKGLKVVAVEKKTDICEVVRTTGNVFRNLTPMNGDYLSVSKRGDRALVHFHNSDFDIEHTGRLIETHNSYSFSNGGYCMRTTRKERPNAYVFGVETLYSDLKRKAEEAGAAFMAGTLAMTAERTEKGARVQIKRAGKLSWLEADRVIAADGLSSRLVEAMGLNKDRTFYVRGPCFETTFEGVDFPYPVGFSSFRGKGITGGMDGYVFIYPSTKGERAYSVMIQSKLPADQGPKIMDHFTTKGTFAPWFKNAKPVSRTAAMVTLRSALVTPYVDNVLFIGDAPAYGETLVAGAIRCGHHAADAVYKEISGEKGFAEYEDFWASNFEYVKNPMKQADYTKILLLTGYLTDDELDFLYRLAEEKGPIEQSGDIAPSTEYTGAHRVIDYFMSFPEVKGDLLEKLKRVKDADMKTTSDLRKWKEAKR